MARPAAIRAVVVAVVLAALVGCKASSADRGAAGNSLATEAPTTTTTNPYAVPAVIDAAYVNRVLAGLDATLGDVVRIVLRSRTIPHEAYDRLRSVYGTDDGLQLAIDSFQDDLRRGLTGYKPDPGNKVTTVSQILTVRTTCVFARVTRDYSAVGMNPLTADVQWVALKPLDPSRDSNKYNKTPWAFAYDGFPRDRSQPADPCNA